MKEEKKGRKRKAFVKWIVPGIVLLFIVLALPEVLHTNKGQSESVGSVREGKLKNGWLIPFRGNNFSYFSTFSYYILNNAYVNDRVYNTVVNAYKSCEATCPGKKFVLMECTRKHGGRMIFHWTHQNGTSVDFMVPKMRKDGSSPLSNQAGLVHYLFPFESPGKFGLNGATEIDFETMGKHILAVDDAAKQEGLRIHKILFNTDLQPGLYASSSGEEIRRREIRIIPRLSELVNQFHDDHYHIDFREAK